MKLLRASWLLCVFAVMSASVVHAQTTDATVNGLVLDSTGAVVVGASVQAINDGTNIVYPTKTNSGGVYSLPSLPPGRYHIQVSNAGFKTIIKPDITLNVQDARAVNFTLQVGAASETVTVEGGVSSVNTQDASVSTVVDRQFVANIPLNGRSFQSLISLSPGVVTTPTSFAEEGQFSVNGQRADANYFMVDGVSGNIGTSPGSGLIQSLGGGLPGFSASGSTASLVSVDAMQEFRIQTSTFAPEFGRTPGAQVSIATRSGTNRFHGTLFDYFRNDSLDARDWFVNHNHLQKPRERQNDFGGVLGGPLVKDRTFFFFSYEGLRLRQPSTQTTFVPDLAARSAAPPSIQPLLNAFPLPNGPEVGSDVAQLTASFSNPASLNSYSIRFDDVVRSNVTLFGRYSYTPSTLVTRGFAGNLSTVQTGTNRTHTATMGVTVALSPALNNDLRLNYSNTEAGTAFTNDAFGGATPLTAVPFPSGFSTANSLFAANFLNVKGLGQIQLGKNFVNEQRQINVVDSVSWTKGAHQIKFGFDYRWLSPISSPLLYDQIAIFNGLTGPTGALTGSAQSGSILTVAPAAYIAQSTSVYAQDTWSATRRLVLTYGLRWDVNPPPRSRSDQTQPIALQNVNDPTTMGPQKSGSPLYKTSFRTLAPRVGAAYRLFEHGSSVTVFRGGFGLFYDSGSGSLGAISLSAPLEGLRSLPASPFPFLPALSAPPALSSASPFSASVTSADPDLQTPLTYEWNASFDQGFASKQGLSLTYVGASGRDLYRQDRLFAPNANFKSFVLITRSIASSTYDALQAKYQLRLTHGLEAIASYSWAHSIDNASNDSSQLNTPVALGLLLDRGNSDFDVRHSLSGALSYDLPKVPWHGPIAALLNSWSVNTFLVGHSALPVTVVGPTYTLGGSQFASRPNIVAGQPFYLYGAQFPGGLAFNKNAFTPAASGTQGDLSRNTLRGFDAWQDDFSVRRQFQIHEALSVEFRAELFNVFNHPNFGNPNPSLASPAFGQATQTLAQFLSPSSVGGGFSPLYQVGGPRSVQLALKITF